MSIQVSKEIIERFDALLANARAIRALISPVEASLGPKGLDTMLVDRFGEIVVTNAGSAILEQVETVHPAEKMLVKVAKSQHDEIGDGTTTATIMASTLITEGVNQIMRGVPVTRVLEGIRLGISEAVEIIRSQAVKIDDLNDLNLRAVALVAGRNNEEIADLIIDGVKILGKDKCLDSAFKLRDTVISQERAKSEVFGGIILDKVKINEQMPSLIKDTHLLLIDDALEPEELEEEAIGTESGFKKFMELREEFKSFLKKIIQLRIGLILVNRQVDPLAEEMLGDVKIAIIKHVPIKDLKLVAEYTGATLVKRTSLKKDVFDLKSYLGSAKEIAEDKKHSNTRIIGGSGKPMITILVSAPTEELIGEKKRIAGDAASSVQAAVKEGIVPGGGAVELYAAKELERIRDTTKGMVSFGINCVIEALKKPLRQIIVNSGFNPLEKLELVLARQIQERSSAFGLDCDEGDVINLVEAGVVDPLLVKVYALQTAGEFAESILRINTIINMKDPALIKQTVQ